MKKAGEIRIRDPFVLVHDGCYYLYGTIGEPKARELYVHKSRDLEHWEEPTVIYTLSDDSWAEGQLWAPEVHEYRGKFYLFLSIKGKNGLRGTEISSADTPVGPFIPLTSKPATPEGKSCIDGTLYVEDGHPYMIYSHDWPDCYCEEEGAYIGEICAVELSEDLTHAVGEPFMLFSSKDAPLSGNNPHRCKYGDKDIVRYGSDGPFVTKLSDGRPFLLWSPMPGGNYVVLGAVADHIRAPWQHIDTEVFADNGGHPMVFTDLVGQKQMAIHWPEVYWKENLRCLLLTEKNGHLSLK